MPRSKKAGSVEIGDVDAVIRMIETEDSQLTLPTLEKKGRVRMAQIATRKAAIVARTPAQDAYIRAMERTELVFGAGPAGTGKTYLAVAHAASLLERGDINRIILSRPAVEAGERLGFLPGDMKEKVDPYLRPLYDALYDMMRPEHVERCHHLGHHRGRPARLHARPHAVQCRRHSRRGAEHHLDADEDVPDPSGRELEDDRHRRSDARSTCRAANAPA